MSYHKHFRISSRFHGGILFRTTDFQAKPSYTMGNTAATCSNDDEMERIRVDSDKTAITSKQWEEEPAGPSTNLLDEVRELEKKKGDFLLLRKRTFSILTSVFGIFGLGPYLWKVNRRYQCTKLYLTETNLTRKNWHAMEAQVNSTESAQRLLRQPYRFLATMPGPGSKSNICFFGYYLYKYVENAHGISEHEKKRI